MHLWNLLDGCRVGCVVSTLRLYSVVTITTRLTPVMMLHETYRTMCR
jgi:hypothetical protein